MGQVALTRGGTAALTRSALLAALLAATPALAQQQGDDDLRFCPTRPSLGSSPCTTQPGHAHVEVSALDWQRDDTADSREDRVLSADLLTRIGIGQTTEVQLGWTAIGHDRERDKASGDIDETNGIGDVTLAIRQHLVGDQQKGFSLGVQPFVTLPAGRYPVGAGDWGAGAIIPVQFDLTDKLQGAFTGEVQAAVNEAGAGRHLAYNGIWGLQYKLSEKVSVIGELSLERDDDPSGHETHALAAWSVAWQPAKRFQLDAQAVAGLNRDSPDIRLIFGGAALF